MVSFDGHFWASVLRVTRLIHEWVFLSGHLHFFGECRASTPHLFWQFSWPLSNTGILPQLARLMLFQKNYEIVTQKPEQKHSVNSCTDVNLHGTVMVEKSLIDEEHTMVG